MTAISSTGRRLPASWFYRPPFAGELKYVHGQHKLHFCQENPNVT
jgi:hypothetical protein